MAVERQLAGRQSFKSHAWVFGLGNQTASCPKWCSGAYHSYRDLSVVEFNLLVHSHFTAFLVTGSAQARTSMFSFAGTQVRKYLPASYKLFWRSTNLTHQPWCQSPGQLQVTFCASLHGSPLARSCEKKLPVSCASSAPAREDALTLGWGISQMLSSPLRMFFSIVSADLHFHHFPF